MEIPPPTSLIREGLILLVALGTFCIVFVGWPVFNLLTAVPLQDSCVYSRAVNVPSPDGARRAIYSVMKCADAWNEETRSKLVIMRTGDKSADGQPPAVSSALPFTFRWTNDSAVEIATVPDAEVAFDASAAAGVHFSVVRSTSK